MASALIIVDLQNDFCEGGSLAVSGASDIVELVNQLKSSGKFDYVYLSQDWHPLGHYSFQENHPGSKLFHDFFIEESGLHQIMWPVHCVQGTYGSEFHPSLSVSSSDIIIKKGQARLYDSYSAFGAVQDPTELEADLKAKHVSKVYSCGLAYDFCVGSTAVDAAMRGFASYVISDATKGIKTESIEHMNKRFEEVGVRIVTSPELLN
mmetsp:Transcript_21512/g.39350  ORF Transcript_21512/g.39350 Transcript_21512/m.39350 type:complete len:207 (-) Transcript_21512:48-668(-)